MAKRHDVIAQRIRELIRNREIEELLELMLEEDIKASHLSLAAEGLLRVNSAESWEAVGNFLAHNNTPVAEMLLDVLETLGESGPIRAIGGCLGNQDALMRSRAVQALARNPTLDTVPLTIPHLLRASRDPEPRLAKMARRVIVRRVEQWPALITEIPVNNAEGVMELMDLHWAMTMLSDSYPEKIRVLAARRLGAIGGEDATQVLVSMLPHVSGDLEESCWAALEASQDVSEYLLLPLLVEAEGSVKARALGIYARFVDEHAEHLLQGMVRDADVRVRISALKGLQQVLGPRSLEYLKEALDDPEPEAQETAARLLARTDGSEPVLAEAIDKPNKDVRKIALTCLARRGVVVETLLPYYLEFLFQGASCTDLRESEFLDAVCAVARNLSEDQHPEALVGLVSMARSIIRRMRRAAIEGIMRYPPETRRDALRGLLDCEDKDILRNVAFGLHEVRDPEAVFPLIRVATEIRGRPQVRARKALEEYEQIRDMEFLVSCLRQRWPSVRRYGAHRLRELADPRSIIPLKEASADEDVEVQLAVVEALQPFAATDKRVTDRMLELVRQGDVSVRQQACEMLGEARCREAVPELIKALHNYFLRPRATQALKMIGDRKGYLAIKRLERRERLFPKKPKDLVMSGRRNG